MIGDTIINNGNGYHIRFYWIESKGDSALPLAEFMTLRVINLSTCLLAFSPIKSDMISNTIINHRITDH